MGVGPDLAGQPAAAPNGNALAVVADADAPAEEQLELARLPHREEPRVLEKEGPLLGEEQVEPVEVDLLLVHLDLREVGVVRQVEGEARGHAVLQVRPDVSEPRGAGVDIASQGLSEHVGVQLEVPRRRHLQAAQLAGQRQPVEVELAGQRRPVRLLVPVADVALEVDAPRLDGARRVAQGAERDGELGRPPDVGDLRRHLPHAVPVQVEPAPRAALLLAAGPLDEAAADASAALALVGELPVVLEPGRVRPEHEPVLLVAVGVEDDLEAVGLDQRRVAPRVRDDDRGGIADEADHPEVDRLVGVDDAHLGPLRRRLALVGGVLAEPGLRGRGGPDRLAQHVAVDDGCALDPPGARDRGTRGRRCLRARLRGRQRLLPRRRLGGGGNGGNARGGQRKRQDCPARSPWRSRASLRERRRVPIEESEQEAQRTAGDREATKREMRRGSGTSRGPATSRRTATSFGHRPRNAEDYLRHVPSAPSRTSRGALGRSWQPRVDHCPTARREAGRSRAAASGAGSPPRRPTPP